jgi:arsenate reductase (thioredoxin)
MDSIALKLACVNPTLDPTLRCKIEGLTESLRQEFPRVDEQRVSQLMDDSVERLAPGSAVLDFLPLLAYRLTRERLMALARAGSPDAETSYVVYVSLSGGGRGQIAAALTTHYSGGRVSVHSAGTAIKGRIDPNVRAVIAEIGVDPEQAFVAPVTDEVLRAADVVVTMGHSVGIVDVPPRVKREDWRVGDPIGAPLDEVRRVRADIDYRVTTLLSELGVENVRTPAAV